MIEPTKLVYALVCKRNVKEENSSLRSIGRRERNTAEFLKKQISVRSEWRETNAATKLGDLCIIARREQIVSLVVDVFCQLSI